MERPRLSALKSWSAGQLALVILAGVLSVWLLGAMAFNLVADRAETPAPEAREVPSAAASVGTVPEIDRTTIPQAPQSAVTPTIPASTGGASFSVQCSQPRSIPRQSSASFDCRVLSIGGFAQPVAISCTNLPPGLNCEPQPTVVTPPANGAGLFKLNLTNYDVGTGKNTFKVVAGTPDFSAVFKFPFDTTGQSPAPAVSPPGPGRVDIQCAVPTSTLIPGQSLSYKCSYSSELYYGTVTTSCSGTRGISCDINPKTVTPRDGQPAEATLSLNVSADLSSAGSNQVIGVYGDSTGGVPFATHKFTVDVPPPDYTLSCPKKTAEVVAGQSVQIKCSVGSVRGYVNPLQVKLLSFDAGAPAGAVTPTSVQVGAGGSVEVTVEFQAAAGTAANTYNFALGVHADPNEAFTQATGDGSHNATLALTVVAPEPSPTPTPDGSPST